MIFKTISVLCLVCCSLFAGCAHRPEAVSAASIPRSTAWRMETACGSEHCYPLVDSLVSQDLRIKLESRFSYKKGISVINVTFITEENSKYTYNPSKSILTVPNGTAMPSHDFTCSNTEYNIWAFTTANYLKEPINLHGDVHDHWRHDCVMLFFDIYPPGVEDDFTLKISGLLKDGEVVDIPAIGFSKSVR